MGSKARFPSVREKMEESRLSFSDTANDITHQHIIGLISHCVNGVWQIVKAHLQKEHNEIGNFTIVQTKETLKSRTYALFRHAGKKLTSANELEEAQVVAGFRVNYGDDGFKIYGLSASKTGKKTSKLLVTSENWGSLRLDMLDLGELHDFVDKSIQAKVIGLSTTIAVTQKTKKVFRPPSGCEI